ncbi:molybdenum cofactor biosynthesis protein B [Aeromonas enteropelogenes]|uniref:Molybdenum cofactor biosynthesis protein B n=2 Tax=Aeromonas TaxID=642 RepID=A0A175VJE0_AEREN|nr:MULTISPECIES: molybdenum cofactor biosynthesis protein B [Aeromonas]KXU80633.1 molybdenum cofactor biosynthesis protein [Aeromonas enteropelogenes]MBL0456799.1 molybdenum cofactor biosynthesis protein B [Aeromonas enteropelogenes]MBL0521129.1 molybdenum cofactor biosynthesis protein B [Aeromonas enteropelogenes]QXC32302.1 molybdenum cofactor biosynthesis protein B [Aeromonas sp. FDAARGOS 1407]UAK71171.1 molybdenum cofactor biosynthesis protein B [Aeromonas enteropelogenes]
MGQKHNEFIPLKIAVLTVSNSRTAAEDSSGDYLVSALSEAGHQLADRALLADDLYQIRSRVSQWIADEGIQVVLVNGGTGFNDQNRVPEAVGVLFDRTVKGFGELFRQLSFAEIKGSAMQSRALAGLANRTLICCLPGSTGACRLGWEKLIRDQLDARTKPCNFVSHL